MIVNLSLNCKQSRLQSIYDFIHTGVSTPKLLLLSGQMPENPESINLSDNILLGITDLENPMCDIVENELVFKVIPIIYCLSVGTITWGRLINANNLPVIDMDVGLIGTNAAIQIDSVSAVRGHGIVIPSAKIIE